MTDQAVARTEDSTAAGPSRRIVLRGVAATGAVVAASALAACDSGGSDTATTPTPTQGGSTPPTTGAPTTSAPAEPQALAKTADIPVGGGKIFEQQAVVITQPEAGDFKGFSARCTHRGCIVSRIEGGTIFCPCHGSQYSIVDASVTGGPAPAPLGEEQIEVDGDDIFLVG
ncbi:MAG: Rieske (2Fe-2S) protein [Sporichthyaceae bacterium]|nr:Rieske (2Fe-2S) protein [Sporichthyaceae bacterium]